MKIIFICNIEELKMACVFKRLALSCLLALAGGGLGFGLATAGAQEPTPSPDPPAGQSPAEEGTDDDANPAPSPDAGAGTDTGADAGTDTDNPGPEIVLAPGEIAAEEPMAGSYELEFDRMRGMQQARLQGERKTTIGGYGELHLNMWKPEDGSFSSALDLHRFVLFFAHRFNDRFQFYSEVELEHAFVAESGSVAIPGEVAIEQAFIDWRLLKGASQAIYLRAGVILVPMGIINQWHEPPIFNGVERPQVDRVIIPTTWREGGIGIWGQPNDRFRYELYVLGGLDASGFSGSSGLRGGRLKVTEAVLNGPAFAGRVEWEPILGMILGLSPYFGLAGPRDLADVNVKVPGVSGDWRTLRKGFESRFLIAYFHVSDTDGLREIPPGETEPTSTVGSNLFGVYGELGYNVLYDVDTEMALVPFVRVDYYDTTLRESDAAFDLPAFVVPTIGLSYRPIPQVVFKFDYQYEVPSTGLTANRWNVGVGWMF
jgi:hypothetical protein